MSRKKLAPLNAVLAGVLTLAALLRLVGMDYDLPYVYDPDEPYNVDIIQAMFRTGDLNPHLFVYPSLSYYVNLLAYVPYYAVGRAFGVFSHRTDIAPLVEIVMGAVKAPLPGTIILGRTISVAVGVGTTYLTYSLGRRLLGSASIGVCAAALVAVAPPCVGLSRLISPDALVVFFAVATVLMCALVLQEGKTWQSVLAGIAVGLTASSKYNGALVIVPLILAHVFRFGSKAWTTAPLYIALIASGIGFVAGTPYALFDFITFIGFVIVDGEHYARGHPGMEGDALTWYLAYMGTTAAVAYSLAALEIVRALRVRSRPLLLLAAFPVSYLCFIASFEVRNDRTLHLLIPFAFLLAASFLTHLWKTLSRVPDHRLRGYAKVGVAVLGACAFLQPALATVKQSAGLLSSNSREEARIWLRDNLDPGSRVAIESYSPFVDPARYAVTGLAKMIDHDPEWYLQQGFEYVVVSEGMYGRYFEEPLRYPVERTRYVSLFERFDPPVKVFDSGGFDIRIYELRTRSSR